MTSVLFADMFLLYISFFLIIAHKNVNKFVKLLKFRTVRCVYVCIYASMSETNLICIYFVLHAEKNYPVTPKRETKYNKLMNKLIFLREIINWLNEWLRPTPFCLVFSVTKVKTFAMLLRKSSNEIKLHYNFYKVLLISFHYI